MNKAVRHLFLCFFLLAIVGFNPAHAEPLVDSRMSGSWYDPDHKGEGFLLEVLESNKAVIYWFTYDEAGAQRWFTSVGEVSKGSLYQGGINVPLFITGPGITRIGERESVLINSTDLFSTIAALAGVNVDQVNDSVSFKNMFGEQNQSERFIQYSEKSTDPGEEWTIKSQQDIQTLPAMVWIRFPSYPLGALSPKHIV
jgi:hypothetical protein